MDTVRQIFAYKPEGDEEDAVISGLFDLLFVKKQMKLYVSSGIMCKLNRDLEDTGNPVRFSAMLFGCFDELWEVYRKALNKMQTENKNRLLVSVHFDHELKCTNEHIMVELSEKEMTVCLVDER